MPANFNKTPGATNDIFIKPDPFGSAILFSLPTTKANNQLVPERTGSKEIYSQREQAVNPASYKAAAAAIGKDEVSTKLWFDKN